MQNLTAVSYVCVTRGKPEELGSVGETDEHQKTRSPRG